MKEPDRLLSLIFLFLFTWPLAWPFRGCIESGKTGSGFVCSLLSARVQRSWRALALSVTSQFSRSVSRYTSTFFTLAVPILAVLLFLRVFRYILGVHKGTLATETRSPCFSRLSDLPLVPDLSGTSISRDSRRRGSISPRRIRLRRSCLLFLPKRLHLEGDKGAVQEKLPRKSRRRHYHGPVG